MLNIEYKENLDEEFYKKCGFEVEFIRENKENPNLTKYFLVKYF